MTFLKSKKRLGQFEALETKKLFAADLAGSADVVSFNPREYTLVMPNPDGHETETTLEISNDKIVRKRPGRIATPTDDSSEADTTLKISNDKIVRKRPGRTVYTSKLGGQEGEPVSAPASDFVLANLGGQEGEDVADRDTENFRSIIHKSGPRPDSEDSYEEIKWT